MAQNSQIDHAKMAEYEQQIAILKAELASLDKDEAKIVGRKKWAKLKIGHFEFALKELLKGTAGDSSSSESSLNKQPGSDVAVSSPLQVQPDVAAVAEVTSNRQQSPVLTNAAAAAAMAYKIVARGQTADLIPEIGKLTTHPELTLESLGLEEYQIRTRGLEFLFSNPDEFVTCGYDGFFDKWQLMSETHAAKVLMVDGRLHGSAPECFAVNPLDDSLVLVYGHKETLISLSLTEGTLKEIAQEPHETGITQVAFLKCQMNSYPVFVSSGRKNHEIVSWGMEDNNWKTVGKYKEHSNTVTGMCGLFNGAIVASVGRDRRAIAYDLEHSKKLKELRTDTECSGIAANPMDYHLLCIQTSSDERQLMLWDVRTKDLILNHEFGWKKSKAKQQTSLIKPVWSPSGLLLSSGTAEETVSIFDIRYCSASNPGLTLYKHKGKVFKVAWAPTRPVLLTTSSDQKIGLHSLKGSVLARTVV